MWKRAEGYLKQKSAGFRTSGATAEVLIATHADGILVLQGRR